MNESEAEIRNKTLDEAIEAMREKKQFFKGLEKNTPWANVYWEAAASSFDCAEQVLRNLKTA